MTAEKYLGEMNERFRVALAYAVLGWADAAKAEMARSRKPFPPFRRAILFAHLGDHASALSYLEEGLREAAAKHASPTAPGRGAPAPEFSRHESRLPYWDPLRGDPRFEAIVASLTPK
jgi:hypothetical protein